MLSNLDQIPEHIPGEPPRHETAKAVTLAVVKKVIALLLAGIVMPPLWLLYLPLRLVWPRPASVPAFSQWRHYLWQTLVGKAPHPGIRFSVRFRLLLELLRVGLCIPLGGLFWYLDEILYGRRLRAIALHEPLFEISGMRSGSTQLGHYIEQDPQIIAPSLLQAMLPYLWLWKLSSATLGKVVNRQWVRKKFLQGLPPAFVERHEGDPFLTDTLDISFAFLQLNIYARALGPDFLRDDFAFGRVVERNRQLWEQDFVRYVDGLGRKTLLFAGGNTGRRLLIKGHFLTAAEALEKQYPDARFLTVIRDPLARIRSAINFVALAPDPAELGAPPWAWCVQGVVEAEIEYCELEMDWYQRAGARRCIVRFADYVQDLEGTMNKIYRECLDQNELPAHVPRQHARRERTNYMVDRSLVQLGVDEHALGTRLRDYARWCESSR